VSAIAAYARDTAPLELDIDSAVDGTEDAYGRLPFVAHKELLRFA
jgi:hypothetical protein